MYDIITRCKFTTGVLEYYSCENVWKILTQKILEMHTLVN